MFGRPRRPRHHMRLVTCLAAAATASTTSPELREAHPLARPCPPSARAPPPPRPPLSAASATNLPTRKRRDRPQEPLHPPGGGLEGGRRGRHRRKRSSSAVRLGGAGNDRCGNRGGDRRRPLPRRRPGRPSSQSKRSVRGMTRETSGQVVASARLHRRAGGDQSGGLPLVRHERCRGGTQHVRIHDQRASHHASEAGRQRGHTRKTGKRWGGLFAVIDGRGREGKGGDSSLRSSHAIQWDL